MLGPATAAMRQLQAEYVAAQQHPHLQVLETQEKHRAEQRLEVLEDNLRCAETDWRKALLAEAIERVSARRRDDDVPSWRQPQVEDVLNDMKTELQSAYLVTDLEVARAIFASRLPSLDPNDAAVVTEHWWRRPDWVNDILRRHSVTAHPHWSGPPAVTASQARLIELLTGDQAQLPAPVVLWRGEYPSSYDASFAARATRARPGEVLRRGPLPMSTSLDPSIAARHEFCQVPLLEQPSTGQDGWLLRITADRAMAVGEHAGGLAYEREVLVHALELVVIDVDEMLIETRLGWRRVQVIGCTPLR